MGNKKSIIIASGASAGFGLLWSEIWTYARGRFYDWVLFQLAAYFDQDDPRVIAAAEFLSLWGPIISVALLLLVVAYLVRRNALSSVPDSASAAVHLPEAGAPDLRAAGEQKYRTQALGPVKADRDVSAATALAFAVYGEWGALSGMGLALTGKTALFEKHLERFRRAAKDGALRVWGISSSDGLYRLIDPSFWEKNTLDKEAILHLLPAGRTRPIKKSGSGERFSDIMVNSDEVRKVWPHE